MKLKPPSVVLAVAVGLAAHAQTRPAQQDTIIRSTTRLVEVHVAAWDKQGNRVTDLEKKDFRIFDDGSERSIISFTVDGNSLDARNSAPRENRSSNAEMDGYSAILLDWLNSSFADRLRGDDALRNVLGTIPARQDVAVYVLGTEPPNSSHPLAMVSEFGGSPADIANRLGDPMILPGPEIPEAGRPSGGNARRPTVEEQLLDWNNRIMDTVRALSDLADRMARLPGRKSLIWLTTGFPITIDGTIIPGAKKAEVVYLEEVDQILAKFNRLNISVHVMNTTGLSLSSRSYNDTLKEFAERTGGTAFLDRNDLDTGVQIALEDMHTGYTLGFLVPDGATPGMHSIKVRSGRRNVKLSYRESYEVSR